MNLFRGNPPRTTRDRPVLRLDAVPPTFVKVVEPMFEGRESKRSAAGASGVDPCGPQFALPLLVAQEYTVAMGPYFGLTRDFSSI